MTIFSVFFTVTLSPHWVKLTQVHSHELHIIWNHNFVSFKLFIQCSLWCNLSYNVIVKVIKFKDITTLRGERVVKSKAKRTWNNQIETLKSPWDFWISFWKDKILFFCLIFLSHQFVTKIVTSTIELNSRRSHSNLNFNLYFYWFIKFLNDFVKRNKKNRILQHS